MSIGLFVNGVLPNAMDGESPAKVGSVEKEEMVFGLTLHFVWYFVFS